MHSFTFDAKRSEFIVWLKSDNLGDIFTSINVLLSPVRQPCKTWVSFELRKGIYASLFAIALITTPNWDKDLLMLNVSFILSPSTLLLFNLSLPAKSIKLRDPLLSIFFSRCFAVKLIVKIKWDLEDLSLHLVSATFLFYHASFISEYISSGDDTTNPWNNFSFYSSALMFLFVSKSFNTSI